MSPLRRYGEWAGNPKGTTEDPTRCIKEVYPGDRGNIPYQCNRKRGYGPDGLYCAQHAKDDERHAARERAFKERQQVDAAIRREARLLSKALGVEVDAYYNTLGKPPRMVRVGLIAFEDIRLLIKRLREKGGVVP